MREAYAYPVMTLVFLIIWAIVFLLLPRSRAAILWTSLIFGTVGPISDFWIVGDYWRPIFLVDMSIGPWRFGFEDYFVAFALSGISAGVFESLAPRRGLAELPKVSLGTLLRMTGWGAVGLCFMAILASGFHLRSVHAIILSIVITSCLMLFRRREVLPIVLPIAVACGISLWLFYVTFFIPVFPGMMEALWNLERSSGIMLAGVPIEETLWAFATALFSGAVFRICSTRRSGT